MASSGQISGTTNYTNLAARMNWSQTKNLANNTSEITLELQMRNTTGSLISGYSASWTVTIDGVAYTHSSVISVRAQGTPWETQWTKTYTVAHDQDGTKTAAVKVTGSSRILNWNTTISIPQTNLALDPIDPVRIASVTQAVKTDGTGSITVEIEPTGAQYIQAEFALGDYKGSTNMDGATSCTFSVPASWSSAIGNGGYRTGSVTVTTYREAAHTNPAGRATGSFTAYQKIGIISVTEKAGVDGSGVLTVKLARANRIQYGSLTVSLGSHTSSPVSLDGGQNQVSFTIPVSWSDAIGNAGSLAGSVTVTSYTAANHATAVGVATGAYTAYKAAGITSVTQKVILDGTGVMTVALNKAGASAYGQLKITLGNRSQDVNVDSVLSYSYTIPASWMAELDSTAHKAGTVKLTCYADSGHTVTIGEATANWTGYGLCTIKTTPTGALGAPMVFNFEKPTPGVNLRVTMTLGTHSANAVVTSTHGIVTEYSPQERTARFTVPTSWGDQFPSDTEMEGTITLTTYPDDEYTAGTELGSTTGTWKAMASATMGPTGALNILWLEQGTYSGSTGEDLAASSRVRTGWIKLGPGTYTISNGAGLDQVYGLCDENMNFILDSDWQGTGDMTVTLAARSYVRFAWRRTNNADLAPGDVTEPRIRTSGGNDVYGWAVAWQVSDNSTVTSWGKAVQGYSKIRVRVYPGLVNVATASGASFAGCRATVTIHDTAQHEMAQSGSYYEYTTGIVWNSGEAGIQVNGRDSRGFPLSADNPSIPLFNLDDTVEVEAYSRPKLSGVEIWRSGSSGAADESGAYIWFKATLAYSSVGGRNSCALKARYRVAGTQNWTEANLTSGTGLALGGGALYANTAYEAEITATDSLGNVKKVSERIPTERIIMHMKPNNLGVGIGGYAGRDGWVESQFSIHTLGDMQVGEKLVFDDAANIPYWNLGLEGTEITSGADFNSNALLVPGNYFCATDAVSQGLNSGPATLTQAFLMRVYNTIGPVYANFRIQEIIAYGGHYMWRRYVAVKSNGTLDYAGSWWKYTGIAD